MAVINFRAGQHPGRENLGIRENLQNVQEYNQSCYEY